MLQTVQINTNNKCEHAKKKRLVCKLNEKIIKENNIGKFLLNLRSKAYKAYFE